MTHVGAWNLSCSCISMTHHDCTHFWHHVKVKVKGQGQNVVILRGRRNPYFLSSFYLIDLKLGGNVAYVQALSWLVFGGDRPWPLGFLHMSKKWRQGQIFMSHKPYHVVPQIEGIDEYFHDQLEFWRYDVIWRHIKETSNAKTFELFSAGLVVRHMKGLISSYSWK